MDGSQFPALVPVTRRIAPYLAALVVGGAGIGYAVHEHNNAQSLTAQNQQVTAQLNATHSQLDALTARVNAMAPNNQSTNQVTPEPATPGSRKPSPASPARGPLASRHIATRRPGLSDVRFKKMQSQLDAQGKAIDDTRSNLASTRTELTGSIARTHGELVVLQKRGERSYFEFDLAKSKDFKREGPINISLRKANTKRGYADLALVVDDRNLSQKHVNLYQPAMFYEPDSPQPVEIVINDISKNHIHGYVSAPRYRQSELAAMANPDQAENPTAQPAARQKLPLPAADPNE
jgi:hypothetical protein